MNENKKKLYCVSAPPLLYLLNLSFMQLSMLLAVVLCVFLIMKVSKNKKQGINIFNKKAKTYLLFIVTLIVYLIVSLFCHKIDTSGDYFFYIISPLTFFVLLLIDLLIAKKYALFRVKFIYILFTLILIILLGMATCSNISNWLANKANIEAQEEKDEARNIEFQKIISEIPKFPLIEGETYSDFGVKYSISEDNSGDSLKVIGFYKSNLNILGWELIDDTTLEIDKYSQSERNQLIYKKDNEDKWLKLTFIYNDNKNTITSINIYFNTTKLSPGIILNISNPLGSCGGSLW